MTYDAADNSRKSWELAVSECRKKLESFPKVEIGQSKLYQGDCLELLPLLRCDHVISDPPYEDELHGAIGRIRRNDGREMIKDLGFGGVNTQRAEIAQAIYTISPGWAIIFCLAEGVRAWRDDLQLAGAKWDTTLAWIKPDASPRFNGQGAARGFECAITCWCGKGYRKWNAGGKRGVYTHCVNGPSRHGAHPTEKPISLMSEIITDFTAYGQTVLDPFMGSGTTGVACAKAGRKFIGVEKEQEYFDIAAKRIEDAYKQADLFISQPEEPKAEQLSILEPDTRRAGR